MHWRVTGRKVLGVGDASHVPIDPATRDYDAPMLARLGAMVAAHRPGLDLAALLPKVLVAGQRPGAFCGGTVLLDPTGTFQPGAPMCRPRATPAQAWWRPTPSPSAREHQRRHIDFAMVVLEKPLTMVHEGLDIVTTPAGDLVAMVHCNNGASELGSWAAVFAQFAAAIGADVDANTIFSALFGAALEGEADGGGLLAYDYLAGEPITGMTEGRPLVVRTSGSRLTLPNFMRTQLYAAFGTLSLGMNVLRSEGVRIKLDVCPRRDVQDRRCRAAFPGGGAGCPRHGKSYRKQGRRVGDSRLARVLAGRGGRSPEHLVAGAFAEAKLVVAEPEPTDVEGYAAWLKRYRRVWRLRWPLQGDTLGERVGNLGRRPRGATARADSGSRASRSSARNSGLCGSRPPNP